MLSRRGFLKLSIAGGAAAYVTTQAGFLKVGLAAQTLQTQLNPGTIPQFVDELPDLLAGDSLIVDNGSEIDLVMTERKANVLSTGTLPTNIYNGTWTWSYIGPGQDNRRSYLGPVILALRGSPTQIKFTNKLGDAATTNVLAYKNSTDQTLHWADPLRVGTPDWNMLNHKSDPPAYLSDGAVNYDGPIPACPHLHGGYVPPVLDGGPDSWFTSDGAYHGEGYYTDPNIQVSGNECIYRYPNDQEQALIWFHDHTLGATRLNVYCGLAGGFLLADPADTTVLPSYKNNSAIVPLVIQDRMFDTNGQFFFPSDSLGGVLWSLNPEHPYWVPEFIGDVICVNGKTWPRLTVKQQRYLFLCVNGSNARTYELSLTDPISKNVGPALWAVGTDGGLLDFPVKIDPLAASNNKLVMMPGERYWVIVDFNGYGAGKKGPNGSAYSGKWILKNTAKAPYPGGVAPQGSTTGRVMQFVVSGGPVLSDPTYNPASGNPLRSQMIRLTSAPIAKIRRLTLNEIALPPKTTIDPATGNTVAFPGGPEEILVNNTKWDGQHITGVTDGMYDMEPIDSSWPQDPAGNYLSEVPLEGTTEIWEIINTTMDAHPIHTHLAQFQLLSRQNYDTKKYFAAYSAAFPGGFDYTLKQSVGPGVFIPAFGPPQDYNPPNSNVVGGNPDVTPYLKGPLQGPLPQENGWKDTVMAPPGMVTRFAIRWALQGVDANDTTASFPFDPAANDGGYVWHCHIVDHEDNEMMRPDAITPNAPESSRSYRMGFQY